MNWIPVEERLPDIGLGFVPVTYRHGRSGCARYVSVTKEWYDHKGTNRDVIAWQPLPEPYRKPRRFVVYENTNGLFEVWRTDVELVKGMPFGLVTVATAIPTREAAQRIADIYEEVYR